MPKINEDIGKLLFRLLNENFLNRSYSCKSNLKTKPENLKIDKHNEKYSKLLCRHKQKRITI